MKDFTIEFGHSESSLSSTISNLIKTLKDTYKVIKKEKNKIIVLKNVKIPPETLYVESLNKRKEEAENYP
jgi:hypothetical protein